VLFSDLTCPAGGKVGWGGSSFMNWSTHTIPLILDLERASTSRHPSFPLHLLPTSFVRSLPFKEFPCRNKKRDRAESFSSNWSVKRSGDSSIWVSHKICTCFETVCRQKRLDRRNKPAGTDQNHKFFPGIRTI
jgi:hypothetical protein